MLIVKAKHWDEKLSPHFSLKEFRCRCEYEDCQVTKVDTDLVDLLEEVRSLFGTSLKITSGYRCEKHNADIPEGALHSYHIRGMAADILVPDHFHKAIAEHFKGRLGLGFYPNRLHIDCRSGVSRWGKIPQ